MEASGIVHSIQRCISFNMRLARPRLFPFTIVLEKRHYSWR
jgi:hypothetical protein